MSYAWQQIGTRFYLDVGGSVGCSTGEPVGGGASFTVRTNDTGEIVGYSDTNPAIIHCRFDARPAAIIRVWHNYLSQKPLYNASPPPKPRRSPPLELEIT